jgi:transcriptional regulator with XRE-family HTH domain
MQVLREQLRGRGLRHRDIAARLQVAERTVSRWLSSDKIEASQIERLCGLLNMTFFDLCEIAAQQIEERVSRLTVQQEQTLAEDDLLLYVFRQLLKGWTADEIRGDLEIPEPILIDALIRLQKLELIELLPLNQVRLRTVRNIEWWPKGPCSRSANNWLSHLLEDADISEPEAIWSFDEIKLSAASLAQLKPKFDQLLQEVRDLSNLDRRQSQDAREWYACILAMRPVKILPYPEWPTPTRGRHSGQRQPRERPRPYRHAQPR